METAKFALRIIGELHQFNLPAWETEAQVEEGIESSRLIITDRALCEEALVISKN